MAMKQRPRGGSGTLSKTAPESVPGGTQAAGPVRVEFVKASHAKRATNRPVDKVVYIRFGSPRLESYVQHQDLKPSNILIGAGLDVTTDIAASAVIEAGFPAAFVRDFALASGLSVVDLGSIVGTSERTMSRKVANREQLGVAESDRAYRIFDVMARAVHAFGDVEKARRWIRRDVPSLGGRKPIDLLRTEIGTRDVLSALDRIEYGGVA
jgi:putative toxin-antitoxin system antitoxin component (TIGR02293 family)